MDKQESWRQLSRYTPGDMKLMAAVLRDQYETRGSLDDNQADSILAGRVIAWLYWFGDDLIKGTTQPA